MRKPEPPLRRLGRTLIWLFQRAGLWLRRLPAVPATAFQYRTPLRSLHFESLEPRLLLSADLMPVALDTAPLSSANDSNIGTHVSIIVRNQGDAVPDKPVIVNLYAQPDAVENSPAVQVGSATLDAATLEPNGADVSARIALDLSALTVPGAYTLSALIDPDGQLAESNIHNNQISVDLALNLAVPFSHLGGGNVSVAFDAEAVSSAAPGTGSITSKYFLLPSTGANFIDFDLSYGTVSLQGQEIVFVGSTTVDAVFVRPGVVVDMTLSGAGADKIYLSGNQADYTPSLTGSVMTLTRGSGDTLEAVRFIRATTFTPSDKIIFADGTLSSFDLYANLKDGTALPALSGETSQSPAAPAGPGSTLNANIKAFALDAGGETFAMAKHGIALTVVGGVGIDTVYVPDGGTVDATLLGGNSDLIYFRGNWAEYAKTVAGSTITFTRSINGVTESVKVVAGSTVTLNDKLIFADGAALSNNAKLAIIANANVAIADVTGFDANTVTPGVGGVSELVISATLVNDTGSSASDGITSEVAIRGTVSGAATIAGLKAGFSANPASDVSILDTLQGNGSFSIDLARLQTINGGSLPDGSYSLRLTAIESGGFASIPFTLIFTLDTSVAAINNFGLAASSDTGVSGDGITSAASVTLTGRAEVGARLSFGGTNVLAGAGGVFQLPGVALADGANQISLTTTDAAGNSIQSSLNITRSGEVGTDAVLTWNQQTLETIRLTTTDPTDASRLMAMVSLAQYDALAAIDGTTPYLVKTTVSGAVSADAAVSEAAYTILYNLFPNQRVSLDAARASVLAGIADGAAKTAGLNLGRDIANAILLVRTNDGSTAFATFEGSTAIGAWRPTAPMYLVAQDPQWAYLTTFALTSADEFRPAPPPALDSAEYAASVEEVRLLGAANSATRTTDQTEIAQFWADGGGTYTPPGHWNQIAEQIALSRGNSLSDNVRLFAQLNVALADAAIAASDAKYFYGLWRPIDAIHDADQDNNASTLKDANWTPLLITPAHPEYVSGHSTYSMVAATVLASMFGDNTTFSTTTFALPGVTRDYTSFIQAAEEAGRSRIFGGIHYEFTNQAGQQLGQDVANAVLARFALNEDTQAPIVVAQTTAAVDNKNFTLTGQILDNLSGVATSQYRIDSGTLQDLALDADGKFSITTAFALDGSADDAHSITIQSSDAAGNVATALTRAYTLDTVAPTITLTSLAEGGTLDASSRLTGSTSATGTTLTQLVYHIDSGTTHSLIFDATTGAFDAALPLGDLAIGEHTLTMTAKDAAGNTATLTRTVTLAEAAPFFISGVTPSDGASDVGVTYQPQVLFSRAVDPTTLTANSLYATGPDGEKLAATIIPALDGRFAWVLFTNPMPGASTITLHVDGNLIQAASDGILLDADGDGQVGGTFTSTFTTVSTASVAGTRIVGRVVDPGPDLEPMTFDDIGRGDDGIIHTADDVFKLPIIGVKVWVLGQEDRVVYTDANGYFELDDMPVGDVKLAVDGRTATNAPSNFFFPEMVLDLQIKAGVVNTAMGSMGTNDAQLANAERQEIYLPRVPASAMTAVSDTEPTTVTVDAQSAPDLSDEERAALTLTVNPGTAIGVDGQTLENVQIGIATVPPELVKDMLPPGVLQHTFDITIQAPGVTAFTEPVQITFPNVFNAAPGTKLNILSFDHTTGRLVINGTGTVSADGLTVTSDEDAGIRAPGWHGLVSSSTLLDALSGVPCGDAAELREGGLYFAKVGSTLAALSKPIQVGMALDKALETGKLPGLNAVTKFFGWVEAANSLSEIASSVSTLIKGGNLTREHWIGLGINAAQVASQVIQTVNPATRPLLYIVDAALKYNEVLYVDQGKVAGAQLEKWRNVPACNPVDQVAMQNDLSHLQEILDERQPAADQQRPPLNDIPSAIDSIDQNMKAVLDWLGFDGESSVGSLPPSGVIPESPTQEGKDAIQGLIIELERVSTDLGDIGFTPTGPSATTQPFWHDPEDIIQTIDRITSYTTKPAVSGSSSASAPHDVYWLAEYDDLSLRGISKSGAIEISVPPQKIVRIMMFDPIANTLGDETIVTQMAGNQTGVGPIAMWSLTGEADADQDGLADIAEHVLNTDQSSADSDEDGISDRSEVLAGTNPLDGRPTATGVLASLPLKGEAKALSTDQSLVLDKPVIAVATGSYGLAFVDASRAEKPLVVREVDLPGDSTDIAFDGVLGFAAVASNAGGLNLVDLNGVVRNIAINTRAVEIVDGIVYASNGGELRAYDLLTGERLQTLNLGASPIVALAREGQMLYSFDANLNLRVIDLSSGNMALRGSLISPAYASRLFVGDGVVYVATETSFSGGYATIDVSNPDQPVLLSGIDTNGIAAKAIALNGSGVAVSVGSPGQFGNLIEVLDASNPANTGEFLTQFALPAAPYDVSIAGGLAYVADGTGGLVVVNYRAFDNQGLAPTVTAQVAAPDADPTVDGLQLLEGGSIQMAVVVNDDVQVRSVELLVNGEVARNDLSYPFELSSVLPSTAANGGDTVTLQVRATDTGGNVGLSQLTAYRLVPDVVGPTLVSSNLTDGTSKGRSFRAITLLFSEPVNQASVNAFTVQLSGLDGETTLPVNIQFRQLGKEVQLTYDTLTLGAHQLRLVTSALTDRVGNAMGTVDQLVNFTIENYSAEWVGPANGFWDTAANWSSGVVPTLTDDVYIGPDAGIVTYRNGTASVATLTSDSILKVTGGTLTVAGDVDLRNGLQLIGGTLNLNGEGIVGGELQVNGGTVFANGALDVTRLALTSGTLNGAGAISVAAASTWSGGTLRGTGVINFNGDLSITGNATKYIFDGRVLNFNATTTWSGNTVVNNNLIWFGAGTINNAGTFIDANGFSTWMENRYSGVMNFNNAGTYRKTSAAISTLELKFNNTGTLDLQAGIFDLVGGSTQAAAILLDSDATLLFRAGTHTLNGLTVTGAGRFEVSGTYDSSTNVIQTGELTLAGQLALTGGTLTNSGTLTVESFIQNDGNSVLTGAGTLNVQGAATWSAGTLRGTGVLNFNGDLAITGNTTKYIFDGRVLNLNATTTWSGNTVVNNNLIWFGAGTINNNATFIDANNFSTWMQNYYSGTMVFNNIGTYRKTTAAISTLELQFNNTGSVDLQAGIFDLVGGSTQASTVLLDSNATLLFRAGTHTLNGLTVTGAGRFEVSGTYDSSTDVIQTGELTLAGQLALTGGTLTNSGTLTVASFIQNDGNSVLTGAGTLNVQGAATWSAGTLRGTGVLNFNGDLAITGNTTKYIFDGRVLNLNATTTWSGNTVVNDNLIWFGAGTINNNATFIDANDFSTWMQNYYSGSMVFNNIGTYRKTTATISTLELLFNNTGTLDIQAGTLSLYRGGTSNGDFNLEAGSTLRLSGGIHTWQAGTQVTGDGVLLVNQASSSNSGTLSVQDAISVVHLEVDVGGTLTGLGTVTITGTGNQWSGGLMSGGGTTTIAADADLTLSGNARKYLGNRTIQNEGTLTDASTGDWVDLDGAAVLNNVGVFDLQGDTAWQNYYGTAGTLTLNNSGTLKKSAGAGQFEFLNSALNNTGSVNVQSGILAFGGDGGVSAGQFTTVAGSEIAFLYGNQTWNTGTSVTGDGVIALRKLNNAVGGTLTVAGLVEVPRLDLDDLGTLTGSGTLTITGTGSEWTGGLMTGGGTTKIATDADLTLSGSGRKYLDNRTLQNDGAFIEASTGNYMELDGVAVLNNVGVFDIRGDTAWQHYAGAAGSLSINNSGTLKKSAGAGQFEFLNSALNNTGSVNVQSGILAFGGDGGVSAGQFTTVAGSEIAFLYGNQTWNTGTSVTGDGVIALRKLNNAVGGTLTVAGLVEVPRLDLDDLGTLTGSGTLTITGTGSEWTGGLMSGGGTTKIATDAGLTLSGNARKFLGNRTIQNEGTLTDASTGDWVEFEGAVVLNNVGVFDLQGNSAWQNYYGTAGTLTLNNSGTLKKSAGAEQFSLFQTSLNNTGTVQVQTGTLAFGGDGGVSTGLFTTVAGSEVAFLFGTQTWQAGAAATGEGAIALRNVNSASGGTLLINADVDVIRLNLGYHGTLGGSGTLTISGTGSQWTGGLMTGGGNTKIAADADLTLSGNARKFLGNRTIQNEGTLTDASTGDWVEFEGAVVLNNVGVFDLQGNSTWQNYYGTAGTLTLNNSGTLKKSAGEGQFKILNVNFTNTGSIDVLTGTLLLGSTLYSVS